jgi:hypothetical protein
MVHVLTSLHICVVSLTKIEMSRFFFEAVRQLLHLLIKLGAFFFFLSGKRNPQGKNSTEDASEGEEEEAARHRLASELASARTVADTADEASVLEPPVVSLPASWEDMEFLCPENVDKWQS